MKNFVNKDYKFKNKLVENCYLKSISTENDFLDIDDVIFKEDVEEIAKELKEIKVEIFTISSNQCDLQEILYKFYENGYKISNAVKVNSYYNNNNKVYTLLLIRI